MSKLAVLAHTETCAIADGSKNNEDEALRSWREALDQIYYNNAFRIPASYKPKNETERALQDSLREMEMQCKERVDLLDALKKSRDESNKPAEDGNGLLRSRNHRTSNPNPSPNQSSTRLGDGTIPTVNYPELVRPSLPQRRSASGPLAGASSAQGRTASAPEPPPRPSSTISPPTDPPPKESSRTPSPEKRGPGMFKSTLRPQRPDAQRQSSGRMQMTMRNKSQPNAGKAATLAWPSGAQSGPPLPAAEVSGGLPQHPGSTTLSPLVPPSSPGIVSSSFPSSSSQASKPPPPVPSHRDTHRATRRKPEATRDNEAPQRRAERPPLHKTVSRDAASKDSPNLASQPPMSQPFKMPEFPTYRREYASATNGIDSKKAQAIAAIAHGNRSGVNTDESDSSQRRKSPGRRKVPVIPRKALATSPEAEKQIDLSSAESSESSADRVSSKARRRRATSEAQEEVAAEVIGKGADVELTEAAAWDERAKHLLKNLPKGVDPQAAKSILNEIVIKGDVVTWDDVAGLDIAKTALKEAVVYPFLRPDLFKGLREPARGMLLFGPPGTGKTMLARAVATMSKSTFFSISASSLTSKFLGESEKLVRALFAMAKALAPSIIFVDEIDSLLSSRSGSGEHEATRRIKTEFLIQWSDLQKAAAGREERDNSLGDAMRVLVLAATNMPWAIDEAARRRFVRRQYIPLPEAHVRKEQLHRLMERQKNSLKDSDYEVLVHLTDGK